MSLDPTDPTDLPLADVDELDFGALVVLGRALLEVLHVTRDHLGYPTALFAVDCRTGETERFHVSWLEKLRLVRAAPAFPAVPDFPPSA